MPARSLAGLFLLLSCLLGYVAYEYGEQYVPWLTISLMFTAMCYVFAPQINWWWWMRHPPDLPRSLHPPLEVTPFYQRLSDGDKAIFRRRVFLFGEAQAFRPQAVDKITDDIKMAISVAAVQVTFHRLNFLFPDYENVIVYGHPFPSPQYPDHMHASEIFEDEHGNGLIFSVEHVMRSFLEPQSYFNVCLYEYAGLLVLTSPGQRFPDIDAHSWPALEQISGFPHDKLLTYIGLDEIDPLQVAIAHFLVFRERFEVVLPELAAQLGAVFQKNEV